MTISRDKLNRDDRTILAGMRAAGISSICYGYQQTYPNAYRWFSTAPGKPARSREIRINVQTGRASVWAREYITVKRAAMGRTVHLYAGIPATADRKPEAAAACRALAVTLRKLGYNRGEI